MHIILTPIRADATLSLHRVGDTISINGQSFDLSRLPDGAVLPRTAVDCPWLASDIMRTAGVLRLGLCLPHGADPDASAMVAGEILAGPGRVDLPGQPGADAAADRPGAIDWTAMVLPQHRLEAARVDGRRRMLVWIEGYLSRFTDGVPVAEMQSWPVKAERARAHLATPPEPTLVIEATVLGEDPDDLARKILEKADVFARVTAAVTGLRRATERAIDAATTLEGIEDALRQALARVQSLEQIVGVSGSETADGF
jgi:hypothetical protein